MHACTYTKVQQGYKSRVRTEHSFSFLQRSSKQGIVKENDPCEFFSSFVAEVAYVQFPFPLGTVGNHGGVPQVNPPVQLHSLLKIMDTKRRVSSKESIRLIASFIFTLPGLQLFYYIWIPGTFVRQVVCLVVRVVYSCLAPNFQVQFSAVELFFKMCNRNLQGSLWGRRGAQILRSAGNNAKHLVSVSPQIRSVHCERANYSPKHIF